MTTYVLAGGCFWCLDAVYRQLKGVEKSVTGYAGGTAEDADYYKVATGTTGHAESQEITFDETIIPKEVILDLFFLIHDPTTLNRQGNDVGPQYRSAMFYSGSEQKADFEAAIERAKAHWGEGIVTELTPLETFYPAEISHQDYYANNPANPYCSIVIEPKIVKARQSYTKWFDSSR